MSKDRNKVTPAVYLILHKEDKILLTRRANTGYMDGKYALPAGHVEASELPIHAIIREVKEEIGIELDPSNIHYVHTMYRERQDETGDRVDIFFQASKWAGEITNMEPAKCDDVSWFPVDSLPEKTIDHLRKVIESVEQGRMYSEIDAKDNFEAQ